MKNHKKLAVVTGAANGIGAGLSREASRRGFRVLMADFDEAALTKTAAEIQDAEILVTDVSNPNAVDALADFADSLGGTDLLFNNAGVMIPPYTKTKDGFENTVGINHLGHFAFQHIFKRRDLVFWVSQRDIHDTI